MSNILQHFSYLSLYHYKEKRHVYNEDCFYLLFFNLIFKYNTLLNFYRLRCCLICFHSISWVQNWAWASLMAQWVKNAGDMGLSSSHKTCEPSQSPAQVQKRGRALTAHLGWRWSAQLSSDLLRIPHFSQTTSFLPLSLLCGHEIYFLCTPRGVRRE